MVFGLSLLELLIHVESRDHSPGISRSLLFLLVLCFVPVPVPVPVSRVRVP